jgi:hypothetical protein
LHGMLRRSATYEHAQPGSQAGLRKSAQPLTFTLALKNLYALFS